jgi:uncharacterized protein involved in exopolysaccharide biosynthesis
VSQAEQRDEVRVSEYAGRVVRRWYVVVACIVVAVLLVVLNSVSGGNRYQAQASVFLGAPLTPNGQQTFPASIETNPTSATAFLRSDEVMFKAAGAAGLKPQALRSHTSITQLTSTVSKSGLANANLQITVLGASGWSRTSVKTAVTSLSDSVITWANTYQDQKRTLLQAQVKTDQAQMTTLQTAITTANRAIVAIKASNMSPSDKAVQMSPLLATVADAGSRLDEISSQMTSNQMFLTAADTIERANYLGSPSVKQVTAASHQSSLIVAAFAGLIVGIILALLWDAFRSRPKAAAA